MDDSINVVWPLAPQGARGWQRERCGCPCFIYYDHPCDDDILVSPHVKAAMQEVNGQWQLVTPVEWIAYDGSRTPEEDERGDNTVVYRGPSLRNAMATALRMPLLDIYS